MIVKNHLLFSLGVSLAIVIPAHSQAINGSMIDSHGLECPAELPMSAIRAIQPPSGWSASPRSAFLLNSAGFTDGPPERLADLIPYSVVKKGPQQIIETWRFDEDSLPDGLWLVCSYGGIAGELMLSKQIDNMVSACTVTYTAGKKKGSRNLAISCK